MSFGCAELMELERELIEKELIRVNEESEQLRLNLLNEIKENINDLSFDKLIKIRNIIKEGS